MELMALPFVKRTSGTARFASVRLRNGFAEAQFTRYRSALRVLMGRSGGRGVGKGGRSGRIILRRREGQFDCISVGSALSANQKLENSAR